MSSPLVAHPPLPKRLGAFARVQAEAGDLLALARANLRYWPTVAPVVRAQLELWQARAEAIREAPRRELALQKLRAERFNPQLATTLATHAPRAHRRQATEAIVALQVAYDYTDALQERGHEAGDDAYANRLLSHAWRRSEQLPGAAAVAAALARAGERCERAQALAHAARSLGDGELRRWATEQAGNTQLRWPEWLAGAQASVLGMHAMIAAAASEDVTPEQADALDRLYLSIGAMTMLDSLVDRDLDRAAGEPGYMRWYRSPEHMGESLAAVARQALRESGELPHGADHRLVLAGIVAFYTSAPAARDLQARAVFKRVRAQLGTLMAPTLAVMRLWRMAGSARSGRGPRLLKSIEL
jgi:tetraprenyl-beta-curcumene synthase